jgi:hypothetical protein
LYDFARVGETRHVVQSTAADDANLCLLQMRSCVGWDGRPDDS